MKRYQQKLIAYDIIEFVQISVDMPTGKSFISINKKVHAKFSLAITLRGKQYAHAVLLVQQT